VTTVQDTNKLLLLLHQDIPNINPSHPLSHRLNRLRVIKPLLGIKLGLELLQFPQVRSIVQLLRLLAAQRRVGVVDVHAPVALLERRRDGVDPAVEELCAVGRVRALGNAVVELDDVELVAVRVRGRVVVERRNRRLLAAVHVELEPPAAVGDLGRVVPPVVDKGLGRRAGEALEGEGLGEENFLLGES
jgi:hypothetical protein